MRSVCPTAATIVALTMFVPALLSGQGTSPLTIVNYQFVSEQRSTRTDWFITYRANVLNTGPARLGVTATLTSLTPSVQVVAGQGLLHFAPVPVNVQVTSSDTFTILVDRNAPFDFANLKWTFLNPSANPGPNQTVPVGTTVTLNGSASTNSSGGGPLTYTWGFSSRPGASTAVLANANSVSPSFVVDIPGNYVITLTVSNGLATDSSNVTVSTSNSPPVARAGPNQSAVIGASVTLNGSGSSDVDGDPLTYYWTMVSQPANSNAFIANFRSVSASFVADKPGTYVAQLVVNDGKVDSAPSTVTISTGNTQPVANAGPNQTVAIGSLVQLNGAASTDVDGDALTYKWTLITVPVGSNAALSSTTVVNPTFTAGLAGMYVAQLVVNDGKIDSLPKTVTITTQIGPPTANAGANQTVVHGTTVTLNGSGTDPQGLTLTYTWSLITRPAGSNAALSNTNNPSLSFGVDKIGMYVAQLIVSNGTLNSAPSTVTITTTNTAPVADAGPNQTVAVGALVSLNGGASSDADQDPITYLWSFSSKPAGSTTVLSASTSKTPTFFADVTGTYVVQLIVNDGFSNGLTPSTVTITAAARAIGLSPNPMNLTNAPGTLTITLSTPAGVGGQVVTLTGFDPNVISVPASILIPENATGANVAVTPIGAGTTNVLVAGGTYQPASLVVTVVTPTITVALNAPGVGITRTINGTVTLSVPAPVGGTVVTLAVTPSGAVSFIPLTVTIAAGASSGTFTVTGVLEGQATVTASSSGYIGGSASVLVVKPGAIVVAQNVLVGPGQSTDLNVSLTTPAPSGGVTITLISSDTSKVQVTTTVTIAQNATTPVTQPQVTGVAFGSALITATGTAGFTSDSQTVRVGANLTLSPASLTLAGAAPQNLTLTLSSPAPTGGLTVTLASSPSGIVTVPATATIAAGATSTTFAVTGVTTGSTTITASTVTPNISSATAAVTVQGSGTISIPSNVSVALGQSGAFQVTLSNAAPAGGTVVTLSSSNSKVSISPATVTILAGATQPTAAPQVTGSGPGSANITASAPFYTSATQAVQVTATMAFTPLTLSVNGTETKNLTLTLSGPAPVGGFVVTLNSSSIAAATVPATATIAAGATTVTVPVTGVAAGTTTIRATAAGLTDATAAVTVTLSIDIIVPATMTLGPGDSVTYPVTLAAPAPSPSGLVINLTSSDATKAVTSLGSISFNAGQTTPTRQSNLNGLVQGTTTITATAAGLNSASTLVTVGLGATLSPANLTILGITSDGTLTLSLSGPAQSNLSFTLTSSNPAVASVPNAVPISVGGQVISFKVTPASQGTTTIKASAAGFPDTTALVTVLPPGVMTMAVNTNSIKLAQAPATLTVTLSPAAPAGGLVVTLGADPKKLKVPATIVIPAGSTTGTALITGENVGNHTLTASALGYSTPTPIVMQVGAIIAWENANVTSTSVGQQVQYNLLLFSTVPGDASFNPADGIPVNITSSNLLVATVQTPANFFWDGSTIPATRVTVNIIAPGTALIHASGVNIADVVMTLNVNGPLSISTASLPNGTVNTAYTTPLAAVGGVAPYAWSATGLPTGLTINSATGMISGTPTVVSATNSVVITVTDASASILTGTKTLNLAIVQAAATSVAVSSGSPQTTVVSTAFTSPLVAIVKDATNQPVPGVTVTFAAPASGASATLSSTTATTNGAGLASITVTANGTTGAYNVSATATGVATAVNFALTNTAGAGVSVSSGSPQTAVAGTAFTNPLVAIVKDAANLPVQGVTVTFAVPGSGASATLSSATAVTNAAGLASVTATANSTTGAYTVAATIAGSATPANFLLTNAFGGTLTPANLTLPNSVSEGTMVLTLSSPLANAATFTLTSSNIAVATTPPSLPLTSGTNIVGFKVTAHAAGTSTITASSAGYQDMTATVTVNPNGTMTMSVNTANIKLSQAPAILTVTLNPAAPVGGTTVTLVSDPKKLGVATTLVIPAGSTTGTTTVSAENLGDHAINASAPGYNAPAPLIMHVGAVIAWEVASSTVINSGQQLQYNLLLFSTIPGGNTLWTNPGDSIPINITSSRTDVATVQTPVNFFWDGSTIPSSRVTVNIIGPGTAQIHASGINTEDVVLNLTVTGPLAISTSSLVGGVKDVAYSAPMAATGGAAPYTWSATGLPAGLTINATTGLISGTPTAVGSSSVVVTVHDATAPAFLTASGTFTLVVTTPPISITTTSLVGGTRDVAYSAPLAATGGLTAYTWSATGLPAGLTINAATGQISGTPTAVGTSSVVVTVTDSTVPTAKTDTKTLSLVIVAPTLAISTTSLVGGTTGIAYTAPVAATGGTTPYAWSATGLPTGLTINATTGQISGTTAVAGTVSVVVTVTDAGVPTPQTASKTLSLVIVSPALTISTTSLVNGQINSAYTAPVAATGGTTPYAWSATGLPAGLTINAATGQISGTPTVTGTFASVVVTVTDATVPTAQTATKTLSVLITPPIFTITTTSLVGGTINVAYSASVAATGGVAPYSFSATGLPAGLTISAAGAISGTPTVTGTFPVAVTATDTTAPTAQTVTKTLSLVIVPPVLTISTASLSSGTVSVAYSATVAATGGTAPYAWSATGLPTGLTINATTGVISGTTTIAGSNTVVVTVTDASSTNASKSLTLVIVPPAAPATITIVSGDNQNTKVTNTFAAPLVVLVKDNTNNPVPNATVTFSLPLSGASGSFGGINTAVTNGAGIATSAVLTAGTVAGTYNITANLNGLTPASFTLTNKPGDPSNISVVSGSGQQTTILSAFGSPLKALVTDANSNVISGATVTFAGPVNGASVTFAGGVTTAVTDAAGVATSAAISANAKSGGVYNVSATVAGISTSAFGLTNIVGAPAAISAVSGTPQSTPVNTTFPSPLTVLVTDIGGNPLRGLQVTFTTPTSGAGASFNSNTALTDSSGMATSQGLNANGIIGSYGVVASIPGLAATTSFALTNTACVSNCPPAIIAPNLTIGNNLQTSLLITLAQPAPLGGVLLTITSSNPSLALVGNPNAAGKPSISAIITEGTTTVSTTVQGLAASGTVDVILSAPGYNPGASTITLVPSGFVIAGPNGTGAPFSTSVGATTALTVRSGSLNASGVMTAFQQVRGAFSADVPISSNVPSVGNVTAATVTLANGSDTGTVNFIAGNTGTTDIVISAPAGFTAPSTGGLVNATVVSITMTGFTGTVGQNLQKAINVSLSSNANSTVPVTISTSNPNLLFSKATSGANGVGSSSITINIPPGHSATPDFYMQSLANSGSASYSIDAPGFTSVNGSVSFAPAGFRITSPGGIGAASFTSPVGFGAANILVETGALSGGFFAESQLVAADKTVSVTVQSSNTAAGTISSSPITIAGGTNTASTLLTPVAAGSTTVTANATNFSSAAVAATFTFSGGIALLDDGFSIGKNLQSALNVVLQQVAGSGGTQITIVSNNPALLKLSASPTVAGSNSITVTVPQGQQSIVFYAQGLSSSGSPTYTATVAGAPPKTGTAFLAPSGIVILNTSNGTSISGNVGNVVTLNVITALLDSANTPLQPMSLAGGLALTVAVQSSSANATVPATVSILPGQSVATLPVTLAASGSANITVTQPIGYATPTALTAVSVLVF